MVSALLSSRQVACPSLRVGRRSCSVSCSARVPFSSPRTSSKRVVSTQAATKDTNVSVEKLLEGAKFEAELDNILEDLASEEQSGLDEFEDDEDVLSAVDAAMQLAETDQLEMESALDVANEVETSPEDLANLQQFAATRLASALAKGESGIDLTDADADFIATAAGDLEDLVDVADDVEEVVPAPAIGAVDVDTSISKQQRSEIAAFKLSKSELKNLVPKDWDSINIDWFSNRKEDNIPLPDFKLNVLWMEQNVAISVDMVYSRGQTSPLTEYFFWPRNDAWEEMKASLESRPWIAEREKVLLLNRLTQLINYWQDQETKHTIEEARANFPDCAFATV